LTCVGWNVSDRPATDCRRPAVIPCVPPRPAPRFGPTTATKRTSQSREPGSPALRIAPPAHTAPHLCPSLPVDGTARDQVFPHSTIAPHGFTAIRRLHQIPGWLRANNVPYFCLFLHLYHISTSRTALRPRPRETCAPRRFSGIFENSSTVPYVTGQRPNRFPTHRRGTSRCQMPVSVTWDPERPRCAGCFCLRVSP